MRTEMKEVEPDIGSLRRELNRKWLSGEINVTQYAEVLYDVIATEIDVRFPPVIGRLPREDSNPIRLYRKMMIDAELS